MAWLHVASRMGHGLSSCFFFQAFVGSLRFVWLSLKPVWLRLRTCLHPSAVVVICMWICQASMCWYGWRRGCVYRVVPKRVHISDPRIPGAPLITSVCRAPMTKPLSVVQSPQVFLSHFTPHSHHHLHSSPLSILLDMMHFGLLYWWHIDLSAWPCLGIHEKRLWYSLTVLNITII